MTHHRKCLNEGAARYHQLLGRLQTCPSGFIFRVWHCRFSYPTKDTWEYPTWRLHCSVHTPRTVLSESWLGQMHLKNDVHCAPMQGILTRHSVDYHSFWMIYKYIHPIVLTYRVTWSAQLGHVAIQFYADKGVSGPKTDPRYACGWWRWRDAVTTLAPKRVLQT